MKRTTLIVFLFSLAQSFAGPLEELRVVSGLPAIDLGKLKRGEIVGSRGPLGKFSRGIYGESAYFIHAPVAVTAARRLRWDSSKYRELDVRVWRQYAQPASPSEWDSLTLKSDRDEDRWLINRTLEAQSVYLSEPEIAAARLIGNASDRDNRVTEFWRKVLRARSDAVASGGLAALPAFSFGGGQINPRSEFESLMRMAPSITGRFAPLTRGRPFAGGGGSADEIIPHWDVGLVRGHTNLQAGFRAARKSDTSLQLAHCNYFVSDTYFFSVTLYEFWPVENGTLVWQIDFASVPFRSYTGGVDRVIAGRQMLKEAAQIARLFRGEIQKGR